MVITRPVQPASQPALIQPDVNKPSLCETEPHPHPATMQKSEAEKKMQFKTTGGRKELLIAFMRAASEQNKTARFGHLGQAVNVEGHSRLERDWRLQHQTLLIHVCLAGVCHRCWMYEFGNKIGEIYEWVFFLFSSESRISFRGCLVCFGSKHDVWEAVNDKCTFFRVMYGIFVISTLHLKRLNSNRLLSDARLSAVDWFSDSFSSMHEFKGKLFQCESKLAYLPSNSHILDEFESLLSPSMYNLLSK